MFRKTAQYVKGQVEDVPKIKKKGKPLNLLQENEQVVADWVQRMAWAGFLVTNNELLNSIQYTLNNANIDKHHLPTIVPK